MIRSFGAAFRGMPASVLVCGVALFGGLLRAEQAPSQGSATVYVAVADNKGNPVAGLSASDFAVEVGGAKAQVTNAAPATDPMSVAVVLSLGRNEMPFVHDALSEVTKELRANNPENREGLTKWEDFTVAFDDVGTRGDPLVSVYGRRFPNPVEPLRGVVGSVQALGTESTPRHVVLVIAPIGLMQSQAQSKAQMDSFDGLFRSTHTSLWVVTIENIYSPATGKGEGLLSLASNKSGGRMVDILNTKVLASTTRQLLSLVTSEYTVTYGTPVGAESGGDVHVGVQRAGTTVFAPVWPY